MASDSFERSVTANHLREKLDERYADLNPAVVWR